MTSFSSLPLETRIRIVEIYLIASAEFAAAEQQPAIDGGRSVDYWISKARQDIWPLASTSKELQREVMRLATKFEKEWREERTELMLRNPCNSSQSVGNCYGNPGYRFCPTGRQLCEDCSKIHTISAKMCHIYWAIGRNYSNRHRFTLNRWCLEYESRNYDLLESL